MFVFFHLYARHCLDHWVSNKKLHELKTNLSLHTDQGEMAVVDSMDRVLGLGRGGRAFEGKLDLVI